MATAPTKTISGTVQSKSRKGNSIKVDDEWYSVFSSADLDHVNWKDEVVFNYAMKGDYRNIKGKVRVSGSGGGSSAPKKKDDGYLLGVELGHASKLAMDMSLKTDLEVGSPEFYKFFMEHTQNVHKMMKVLKDTHAAAKEEEKEVKSESSDVEEDVWD